MNAWGHARRGRWSWSWDVANIPRPSIAWYWRGGLVERVEGPEGWDDDERGPAYRTILAAADDPVGTLSVSLADGGSDPIVSLSIEFAAPRWLHGPLGKIAR